MVPASPPRRSSHHRGFTMIEVLVVVVVLGILGAIVVFSVGRSTDKAQTNACAVESRTIQTALNRFQADTGAYPTASEGFGVLSAGGTYLQTRPSPAKWLYNPAGSPIGIGRCAAVAGADTPEISGTVTVFAATSLTNGFNDLKTKLVAVNPGLTVNVSYAGSNALKAQIDTGTSPADVFAAADELNSPNAALVGGSQIFATNKLAIITRPGNPANVTGLADLFSPGRSVVLCQTGVPCGTASNTAFATIGKTRADLLAAGNLASETANVGLVTSSVTAGTPATVGIVYATDAKAAGATVTTVGIPDATNAVNRYPIYSITSGTHSAEAAKFIAYVMSPEGQAILAERGFGPP